MVDIQNHEESLRELSKTSLVNNLTLILCWSSAEAGRYLELYKSYEHASANSIRAHQATSYADKLVEFITVPRSINKTDAVGLVSAFGSVRAAVNARPEEIAGVSGWGEKKVVRWCGTVREPFRVRKAARRGIGLQRRESSVAEGTRNDLVNIHTEDSLFDDIGEDLREYTGGEDLTRAQAARPSPDIAASSEKTPARTPRIEPDRRPKRSAEEVPLWEPGEDEAEALLLAAAEDEGLPSEPTSRAEEQTTKAITSPGKVTVQPNSMNEGMMAALAKLRQQ